MLQSLISHFIVKHKDCLPYDHRSVHWQCPGLHALVGPQPLLALPWPANQGEPAEHQWTAQRTARPLPVYVVCKNEQNLEQNHAGITNVKFWNNIQMLDYCIPTTNLWKHIMCQKFSFRYWNPYLNVVRIIGSILWQTEWPWIDLSTQLQGQISTEIAALQLTSRLSASRQNFWDFENLQFCKCIYHAAQG